MKVLILSQYYDPEPVPKPAELATALLESGHEVTTITGLPNYPSGQLYPGYRLRLWQKETMRGIRVLRAFEYPYHGRSVLKRLVNFWSFALSAPVASLFVSRPDVMYVWHPPLTIGVAAWLISRLRRVPFVYDVQDIWPEIALLSGLVKEGLMVRLMLRLERFVYRRADHILCVTEGARQNIIGKGVASDKVTVMPHWIDDEMLREVPEATRVEVRNRHGWSDQFVVIFAGNLGLVQGLDSVVCSAAALDPGTRVLIVFIGDGVDKDRLMAMAKEQSVETRVQFLDRQPMTAMPDFFAAADVLLVHVRRSQLAHYVIPTKTLAYLASGKLVVMAMEGAAADLVRESGGGVVLSPDDPEALAAELQRLERMPATELKAVGAAGKAFLERRLTKRRVLPGYDELLRRIARKP